MKNHVQINISNDASTVEEESTPLLNNDDGIWSWKRMFYQAFMTSATVVAPLFSYFLLQSLLHVVEDIESELDINNDAVNITFTILSIYLVANNLLADLLSVNPIEEAEWFLTNDSKSDNTENLIIEQSYVSAKFARKSTSLFTKMNRLIALPSFINLAAADAVSIAYFSDNMTARLVFGSLSTILGVTYYNMFSGKQIAKHTEEFIRRLFQKKSNLISVLQSPGKSLEVFIEALSNIIYRSIAAGYIAVQIAKQVFDLEDTHPVVLPWMVIAAGLTFYTTMFSRVLQVHDNYFDHRFDQVKKSDLDAIQISKLAVIADVLIAGSRGLASAWLANQFLPIENSILRLLLSACLGTALFAHHTFVLYKKRSYETVLIQRMTADLIINNDDNVEQIFNKIARYYQNPNIEFFVNFINTNARAARWIGFIGFISALLKTMAENNIQIPLKLFDMLAVASLWGIPTVIADGKVFKQELIENVSYYKAKIAIGAPTPVAKSIHALFYPKNFYNKKKLAEVNERLEYKR